MSSASGNKARGWIFASIHLVFITLGLSLGGLTLAYWQYGVKPRLAREFQAQADILAMSQAETLARRISTLDNAPSAHALLADTLDGVLLSADPVTHIPFFAAVSLELDYDVVKTEYGSLDLSRKSRNCPTCFHSEVALYHPHTGELLGLARFEVSDAFHTLLVEDMFVKLQLEMAAALIVLAAVWLAVFMVVHQMNREIEERLRVEEALRDSEKRFQQLANAAFEGIIIHKDGLILDANDTAAQLVGKKAGGLAGSAVADVFSPEALEKIVKLSGAPDERPLEIEARRADKSAVNLEVRARAIHRLDGGAQVVAFRDITFQKQVENDLRYARDQAESATKLKDKFLALVSHDLRSPLTGVAGTLEILISKKYHVGGQQRDEILEQAHGTVTSLLRLIDDLFTISKLRTGVIRPVKKMVNARSLAEMYKAHLLPLARGKGVSIVNSIGEGMTIYADPSMLGEVLQNLIANAVKFCGQGDRVILIGSGGSISVKDTGRGIRAEMIPHLFDHGVKTTTPGTQGEKGTGLGLPFCHDIVSAHGGRISVQSMEGQGAVFTITLPDYRPSILVIDDQGGHRAMIRRALEGAFDVDVMEAENGKEALALLRDVTPQLVIVDIEMPVMNGYEFITKVRENPLFDSLPLIVATSHGSSHERPGTVIEARQKVFDLGADDFVVKPISEEDLIPRVRRRLTRGARGHE